MFLYNINLVKAFVCGWKKCGNQNKNNNNKKNMEVIQNKTKKNC